MSAPWQAQRPITSFSIVRKDIAPKGDKVACLFMGQTPSPYAAHGFQKQINLTTIIKTNWDPLRIRSTSWACLDSYFCERLLHRCRDWLGVNYNQLEQGPLLEHTPQASFRKTDC